MKIFKQEMMRSVQKLLISCEAEHISIGSAESCTGGLLSGLLTSVSGSSRVFDRGFITYCDLSKHEMLGVSLNLIKRKGAVSEEVAKMMAQGILNRTTVDLSIAITGIAGPGGSTKSKPVGLVYVAGIRRNGNTSCQSMIFEGNREEVRICSVNLAIEILESLV